MVMIAAAVAIVVRRVTGLTSIALLDVLGHKRRVTGARVELG